MKGQKEVVDLLKKGGELVRDFLKGVTTFRVISGLSVKIFPLELLEKMVAERIVEIKDVLSFHSTYRLVKKKVS